jgi:hypothetical protein
MIPQFIFMLKPSPWGQAIGQSMSNTPLVSGLYKNTAAAVGKHTGEAVVATGKSVLNTFGIGAESAQLPENNKVK